MSESTTVSCQLDFSLERLNPRISSESVSDTKTRINNKHHKPHLEAQCIAFDQLWAISTLGIMTLNIFTDHFHHCKSAELAALPRLWHFSGNSNCLRMSTV